MYMAWCLTLYHNPFYSQYIIILIYYQYYSNIAIHYCHMIKLSINYQNATKMQSTCFPDLTKMADEVTRSPLPPPALTDQRHLVPN